MLLPKKMAVGECCWIFFFSLRGKQQKEAPKLIIGIKSHQNKTGFAWVGAALFSFFQEKLNICFWDLPSAATRDLNPHSFWIMSQRVEPSNSCHFTLFLIESSQTSITVWIFLLRRIEGCATDTKLRWLHHKITMQRTKQDGLKCLSLIFQGWAADSSEVRNNEEQKNQITKGQIKLTVNSFVIYIF